MSKSDGAWVMWGPFPEVTATLVKGLELKTLDIRPAVVHTMVSGCL